MTEPTPGVTPDPVPEPAPTSAGDDPKPPTAEDIAKLTAALDKEREARKKAEKDARDALTQARVGMAEDQRKLIEAEEKGRTDAVKAFGERLARTSWIAEAARRNPSYDAASALEDLNVAKFIGDDGEPDAKAIAASVARLVPEADTTGGTPVVPSFDGGARTPHIPNSTASQFAKALGPLLT